MPAGIFAPSVMAAPLHVAFVHEAGGWPLALDSLRHQNAPGKIVRNAALATFSTGC